MAPSIDYGQMYQQAYKAYVNQKYEEAAKLIDQVVQHLTQDPNALLLKGHVYYVLQKFDIAEEAYQTVLNLTSNQELVDFARNGLENISHYQIESDAQSFEVDDGSNDINLSDSASEEVAPIENLFDSGGNGNSDSNNFAFSSDSSSENNSENEEPTELLKESSSKSPFDMGSDSQIFDAIPNFEEENLSLDNPFAQNVGSEADIHQNDEGVSKPELELPSFWQEHISDSNSKQSTQASNSSSGEEYSPFANGEAEDNPKPNQFAQTQLPPTSSLQEEDLFFEDNAGEDSESFSLPSNFFSDDFSVDDSQAKSFSSEARDLENIPDFPEASSIKEEFSQLESSESSDFVESSQLSEDSAVSGQNKPSDDSFDLDAFEEVFGTEDFANNNEDTKSIIKDVNSSSSSNSNNIEYLDDFDEFDDLGNISAFDLSNGSPAFSEVMPNSGSLRTNGALSGEHIESSQPSEISTGVSDDEFGDSIEDDAPVGERDAELFSITNSQEAVPVFTQNDDSKVEAQVNVEQGVFAALENAPLKTKQWLTAGIVGVVSSVVVAGVSFGATSVSPENQRESIRNTGWMMALAAGAAGFVTTGAMGTSYYAASSPYYKGFGNAV